MLKVEGSGFRRTKEGIEPVIGAVPPLEIPQPHGAADGAEFASNIRS